MDAQASVQAVWRYWWNGWLSRMLKGRVCQRSQAGLAECLVPWCCISVPCPGVVANKGALRWSTLLCAAEAGKYWRISGGVGKNYVVIMVFRIGMNNWSQLLGEFVLRTQVSDNAFRKKELTCKFRFHFSFPLLRTHLHSGRVTS